MFQFPGFAHHDNTWCGGIAPAGFPHSDIRGSQGICPSPRLFAACHVLRRLREPQASPMRPLCLSLVFHEWRTSSQRGSRRSRLLDLVVVARSLVQLDSHRLDSRLFSLEHFTISCSQHVNDLISFLSVVPGRLELPTSTLSV